jgi:hypothetical protein
VLQGDKTVFNIKAQPEAQVIAEAIAAFQYNNEKRQTRGLRPLDAMTTPCTTMVGTRPLSIWSQSLRHSTLQLRLASTLKLQPMS